MKRIDQGSRSILFSTLKVAYWIEIRQNFHYQLVGGVFTGNDWIYYVRPYFKDFTKTFCSCVRIASIYPGFFRFSVSWTINGDY